MNKFLKSLTLLSIFLLSFSLTERSFAKNDTKKITKSKDKNISKKSAGKSASYDLASEYSFDDVFDKKKKKTKKKFAIGVNYDLRFVNYSNKSLLPYSQGGFGMSFEYFLPMNWMSLYIGFGDTHIKESEMYYKEHTDTVYFGPRFYFGFLYLGVGAAVIAKDVLSGTDPIFGKFSYSNSPLWDMYFQLGVNLAVSKNLSIDLGANFFTDISGHLYGISSTGDVFLGLKYTV